MTITDIIKGFLYVIGGLSAAAASLIVITQLLKFCKEALDTIEKGTKLFDWWKQRKKENNLVILATEAEMEKAAEGFMKKLAEVKYQSAGGHSGGPFQTSGGIMLPAFTISLVWKMVSFTWVVYRREILIGFTLTTLGCFVILWLLS
jgi:hypothetical protein